MQLVQIIQVTRPATVPKQGGRNTAAEVYRLFMQKPNPRSLRQYDDVYHAAKQQRRKRLTPRCCSLLQWRRRMSQEDHS